ncbi:conserved hypothetical protein [Culex quinquefasciatus]|uniref:Uncharacterized protein n=1 Tax=Culex quinquefasciatus TaxID=7176 RepID=B0XF51_CULQU|nr:conserved hypothetical protein [Culex quinquefasciatus]|eukprot:XP_001868273.1 conserved hypothetical protein [Culex quinquefasciatus]
MPFIRQMTISIRYPSMPMRHLPSKPPAFRSRAEFGTQQHLVRCRAFPAPRAGRKGVKKSMASKTIRKWQFAGGTDTTSGARIVRRGCAGEGIIREYFGRSRGFNKYTRNWEDEEVYSKSNNVNKHTRPRKSLPRPEEFSSGSVGKPRSSQNMRRTSRQSRPPADQRRVDHDRGGMEREYDQQVQQHDGQYRDGRNDGSRYSSDRMANNNNKNKLLNQRSSKEKDRRVSDCKVTTSLQFKNQTRNKTNQRRWFADGWSGWCCRRSGRAQQQCRSAVRKCPEQQDEQRNCFTSRWSSGANVGPATGSAAFEPAQMIPQQPPPHLPQQQAPIQQAQPQPQQIQQQQLHQQQSPYNDHYDLYGDSKMPCSRTIRRQSPPSSRSRLENGHSQVPAAAGATPQQRSSAAASGRLAGNPPRQIFATPQQQQLYQYLFIIL